MAKALLWLTLLFIAKICLAIRVDVQAGDYFPLDENGDQMTYIIKVQLFYDQALKDEHDGNVEEIKKTLNIVSDEVKRMYSMLETDIWGNPGMKIEVKTLDPIFLSNDIPNFQDPAKNTWNIAQHTRLEDFIRSQDVPDAIYNNEKYTGYENNRVPYTAFGSTRQKIPFANAYVMIQSANAPNSGAGAMVYGSGVGAAICNALDKRITLVYLTPFNNLVGDKERNREQMAKTTAKTVAHEMGHMLGICHDDGFGFGYGNCKDILPDQPRTSAVLKLSCYERVYDIGTGATSSSLIMGTLTVWGGREDFFGWSPCAIDDLRTKGGNNYGCLEKKYQDSLPIDEDGVVEQYGVCDVFEKWPLTGCTALKAKGFCNFNSNKDVEGYEEGFVHKFKMYYCPWTCWGRNLSPYQGRSFREACQVKPDGSYIPTCARNYLPSSAALTCSKRAKAGRCKDRDHIVNKETRLLCRKKCKADIPECKGAKDLE